MQQLIGGIVIFQIVDVSIFEPELFRVLYTVTTLGHEGIFPVQRTRAENSPILGNPKSLASYRN